MIYPICWEERKLFESKRDESDALMSSVKEGWNAERIIKKLYDDRISELGEAGINVSFEQLLNYYESAC